MDVAAQHPDRSRERRASGRHDVAGASARARRGIRSRRFRATAGLGALATMASMLTGSLLLAAPASAAPGDPFPASDPLVFVAQQQPTQLYQAVTNDAGEVEFTPEGPVAPVTYNGISYNQDDDYLYGVVAGPGTTALPLGSLVRVGQGGVLTRVGTGLVSSGAQNVGGFFDGLLHTTSSGSLTLNVTDTDTGAVVRTVPLSQSTRISDWTSADGFLWGISDGVASGPVMVRTNPTTGQVTRFPAPAGITAESAFGAAWTFGNGNLGFSANDTGTVYQISIDSPASASPVFTLIGVSDGPASSANDGAASFGSPTDLAIVKTGPVAILPSGGTITYTLAVINNGPGDSSGYVVNDTVPAPLTNVASADEACTVTGNDVQCIGGALPAGDTATFTVTASVPAGVTSVVENTATVTANEQDPVPGNNTSTTTAAPAGISLVKNAGTPVDVNGNGITDAGDTIQFTFTVTNTGEVELTDFTVDDPLVGAVTCPEPTLAVDAVQTCSADAPYTITAADADSGSVENTATVTGTTPDGEPITSTPSTTTTPTEAAAPALTIAKSASPAGPDDFEVGQVITYTFVVTNTGNVPVADLVINEDEFSGTGELSDIVCEDTTLAVDAQTTCQATYTLTAADVDSGSVTNTATATGTPPGGDPVTSTPSTAIVPVTPGPELTVVKTADVETVAAAGDVVTYSFLVTNTGNVTITDVAIDEVEFSGTGELSVIDCPTTTLATGEDVTCTATYTVTQEDVDAGTLENTATAGGTTPTGDPVTSTPSTETVEVPAAPELTVVKSADVETVSAAGDVVTYSFLVTNTGNVTVSDVAIDEVEFSGTGELSAIECATTTVAPGASVTCTATYTVTQADVDAGTLDNTATAGGTTPTGDPVTSTPSTETVEVPAAPGLTVVKTADVGTVAAAGDVVTYSFLVTNTGNVTVSDVAIDEVEFSGTGELSAIDCPTTTVAPGASVTCTATYTVTQADVDAGTLENTATAGGTTPTGDPVTSTPSTETVEVPSAPELTVVKTADVETVAAAGETVTYSFLVTNTGNVTISDVTIDEVEFSGTGELSAIDCPTTTLAVGEDLTCTATYTVTQEDVDAGTLENTATAGGTTPTGDPVTSTPSTETVEIPPAPALTVVKTADVEAAAVGQIVTYSFLVTNTGNVTITDPTIDDVDFSGSGELSAIACPDDASIAPGEEITCTATYTVTQADIDAGELSNTATASGTTPTGDPTGPSTPSTEIVTTDPLPALTLVKSADVVEITRPGQVVTYSFLVTNTGNVTMTDITVNEGEFSGNGELSAVTCPDEAAPLEPGEAVTCTATYTVVTADLSDGRLTNTATVSGTTPDGGSLTSTPSTAIVTPDPVTPTPTPTATPTPTPVADGEDLAVTGATTAAPLVGLAAVLLAVGGVLVFRRRKHAQDDAS
jgi:uncharacterized repeat protein (TIGR01451 family)